MSSATAMMKHTGGVAEYRLVKGIVDRIDITGTCLVGVGRV